MEIEHVRIVLNAINNLRRVVPYEILQDMMNWQFIQKSPYGHSYYSKPKTWGHTEDGTMRISDHWNFKSKSTGDKIHCPTDVDVKDNSHWTLARYDASIEKFVVLVSMPMIASKKQQKVKHNFHIEVMKMMLGFEIALNSIVKQDKPNAYERSVKSMEAAFLKKQLKLQEQFGPAEKYGINFTV